MKPLENTVKLFKIFADQTRLNIIALLMENDYCVQDIATSLSMSHSSVSHQLKRLRSSNIVKAKRQGKHMIYSLKDEHVKDLYAVAYAHANHC